MKNDSIWRTLRYHLGSQDVHTVYEAEIMAVILALHILTNYPYRLDSVTIGMDNQAVLLGMQNQKCRPSHHLMDKIHDLLEDFQVAQARLRGIRVKGNHKGQGRTTLKHGSLGWKMWELKQ